MKSIRQWTACLAGLSVSFCPVRAASGATPPPAEWPRVIFRDGVTNTIYQPQLESWDYFTLKAIAAVAVQPKGVPQPTFGTIHVTAKTHVDRVARQVAFEELKVTQGDFPSAGVHKEAYLATLRTLVAEELKSISLDRMEASLGILEAQHQASGQPLKNDPPTILFSTKPAMLVLVDGPPVYRPVEKTELERVLNTRALILRDKSGKHYLHLFDGYVEAPALSGPWTIVKRVSHHVKKAEKEAVAAKQVDLLAGQENPQTKKKPSLKTTSLPALHVMTAPTELIVLQGEPQWTPIPTTQLLCATNTVSHVFKELTDQKTYVLISGRWFRSASFDGPWEFVPGANLSKEFAKIPDDSPQENVKASVPGTHQAREAAIANTIPHTVKVERARAKIEPVPQYEGAPQLKPIDGTPLHYAANCPTPVIQVDAKSWYACANGVWFVATAATGPWVVSTSVPAVIYSIPPSSPMHYVTYVRIYRYDATFVWLGTTPGYYGTMVNADGVVVYGTGYYYPPYVGTGTYVSYSVTYGYGSNPCWTPWAGWAFGFSVGWAMACPPAPFWGPYWYPCYGAYYNAYGGITAWGPYGWAGTSGYIYQQHGSWSSESRYSGGYNAWTGNQWASQYGRAYNSSTGTRVAGERGGVENVYTGNYAYGGRGAGYNEKTGIAGAGSRVTWGNEGSGNQGTAGRATIYNPNTGNTTHIAGGKGEDGGLIGLNGHVLAGKDGDFYRPDGQGGWDQITRPTAGTGTRPDFGGQSQWSKALASDRQRFQSLDNEFGARQWGELRQHSFQMNRPSFGFGGRFGGFRRR